MAKAKVKSSINGQCFGCGKVTVTFGFLGQPLCVKCLPWTEWADKKTSAETVEGHTPSTTESSTQPPESSGFASAAEPSTKEADTSDPKTKIDSQP